MRRESVRGRPPRDKASKANITDSQHETLDYATQVSGRSTYGDPPGFKYRGATFYGDKGTLKASVMSYDFIPAGGGQPIREDVAYEFEKFPEDKTEKDLETHVAPAIRAHMTDFLSCIESRGKPVADIEQGYMSAAACILANISMGLGRSLHWDHAKGLVVGRRGDRRSPAT